MNRLLAFLIGAGLGLAIWIPLTYMVEKDKKEWAEHREVNLFCLVSGYQKYTWETDGEGVRHYFCTSANRTIPVPLPPSRGSK